MAEHKLIGKNFTPPDVIAKVTGRAKYAEDFRAEGMLFAKLLRSPMPHAKVRSIDASAAEKMKGVVAVLLPTDVPQPPAPAEPILAAEPMYLGEPVAAVAAVDEATAAAAVERIKVDWQPMPFVSDPLDSLRPGGPNANTKGNVANVRLPLQEIKWSARDFASIRQGKLPMGKPAEEWSYGDIEKGFAEADVVIEESFVTQALSHHPMEPRSAMAYWQNGKLYLYGSTQSLSFVVPGLAKLVGLKPHEVVLISENTGGGFGSKAVGYPQWAIPAFLSKKAGGRPVLMRVTRDEEHAFGRSRAGFQGWAKFGFRADGRIVAADVYVVHSNGPYHGFWDFRNLGHTVSMVYTPLNMRWRGVSVLTNTPPRGPQRGPGENQTQMAMEPIMDRAARKLGLDRVALRHVNAPRHDAKIGHEKHPITSSYLPEALEQGAKRFNWSERIKRSGQRNGTKLTGIGVGIGYHNAGAHGFDGLVLIKPDGKLYIHNGPGNLGTYSFAGTARAAAEALKMPWEQCEVVYGNSGKHLPWNLGQFGSNSSYTMTRTNWVAGMDAKEKLQEIAARELGGKPADYDVADGRVFRTADKRKAMTLGQAAQKAIALGGKYSGKTLPDDINPMTAASAAALAGQGLVGVAKDKLETHGEMPGFCVGFVELEVDAETGHVAVKDYLGVSDCGTVIHPQSLGTQITGGAVQGFGMAMTEKHIIDPKYGLPGARGLYQQKPPTYLDVPLEMAWDAVNKPDPYNPVGAKGAGEPPLGAAASAVLCAISDALGGVSFARAPVTADMVVNAIAGRDQAYKPLEVNV